MRITKLAIEKFTPNRLVTHLDRIKGSEILCIRYLKVEVFREHNLQLPSFPWLKTVSSTGHTCSSLPGSTSPHYSLLAAVR